MCAGIVSVAKPISIECQMANYSNHLYQGLEEESGVKTGQLLRNLLLSLQYHLWITLEMMKVIIRCFEITITASKNSFTPFPCKCTFFVMNCLLKR